MTTRRGLVVAMLLALTAGPVVAQRPVAGSDDVEVLLQAALHREQVEGQVSEAIAIYRQIVATAGPTRKDVAARAQLQLARAYEKTGQPGALDAYQVVVRDFADHPVPVAAATERLAVLKGGEEQVGLSPRLWGSDPDEPFAVTPDGRWLFETTERYRGPERLTMRDLVTGEERVLATREERGWPRYPVLSPDGRQLAWEWTDLGDGPGLAQRASVLRVMDLEAGTSVDIAANFAPMAWSPDGESILVRGLGPDAGGSLRERAQAEGLKLAWVSPADGTIRVIHTFDIWQLGAVAAMVSGGRWEANRISLSPDGSTIVYSVFANEGSRDDRYIMTIDAHGGNETAVVTMAGNNVSPVWTPDGRHLVFVNRRAGDGSLWSVAVAGGRAIREPVLLQASFPGFIVDMTQAAELYYTQEAGGGFQTFVVRRESGRGRVLQTFSGHQGGWSHDNRMAFFRQAGQSTDLIVRVLDTGVERSYSHPGLTVRQPQWLPDSSGLIVHVRETGVGAFYRLDLQTGVFTRLFSQNADDYQRAGSGAVSPDGTTFYMATRRGDDEHWTGIDAIDLATGNATAVVTFPQPGYLTIPDPSSDPALDVSPDGETLALSVWAGTPPASVLARIVTVRTDGTGLREVHGPYRGRSYPNRLRWTPDGESLLFVGPGMDGWAIDRVSATGGEAVIEVNASTLESDVPLPSADPVVLPGSFDVSPDGTRVAFGWSTYLTYELWSLDNVLTVIDSR